MTGFVLLTVEDRFQFANGMLVVVPDFPAQEDFRRPGAAFRATLITPDGEEASCQACLHMTHFNIPGSDDPDAHARLTCELQGVSKTQVKIGSHVIVYDEMLAETLGLAELHA